MSKKLDRYDLSELKDKIDNFDNTKKSLESTIKLLEQDVKDKKVVDVSEKEKQLATINEEYKNLDDMYTKLNATLEKLKSSTTNIEKYLVDNKKIQCEYDVIKVLSDTANGSLTGKQRITFENYVQSYFMQTVLVEANKRLIKMTDSRYELKRKETEVKLNAKTGLDFSIFDSYTGKERDVASLSGGEKFKASLALALGLSDAISNNRGGIKIDSLFIDEGFGSLDSESLNQALNILSDISGNDKLVGVISHVSELMSRIDNKILVNCNSEFMEFISLNNKQKNEKYANLMDKLKKSVNNEFYYEAIFIEYAILEDRTESLLRHAKLKTINSNGNNLTLAKKLSVIRTSTRFNKPYIKKNITFELLDRIYKWKNKRNTLMHDLIKCPNNNEQVKNIAIEGYEIVKKMNSKSTMVNKFLDSLN